MFPTWRGWARVAFVRLVGGEENKMDNKEKSERVSFLGGVRSALKEEEERRKNDRSALLSDIAILAISLFFARTHFAFGSYPLASALLAVLPSHVWVGLIGGVAGSLTMGRSGFIAALNLPIIVFLRLIMSHGGHSEKNFNEPYVMRVASAAIGSAISSAYNIILGGFTTALLLSAAVSLLFSVALSISFWGLFSSDITFDQVVFGTRNIFLSRVNENTRFSRAAFQASFLVLVYLIGFSVSQYDFFGITLTYILASGLTLFVAKRFGAVRAMAVGFATALPVSSMGAVGYALSGLGAGALFGIGFGYAVIGGAALLCLWASYTSGLLGFLSVFPEFSVSALLLYPFLKNAEKEHSDDESEELSREAEIMIDSMLSVRRGEDEEIAVLEEGLMLASGAIKEYGREDARGEFEEYRNIVIAVTSSFDVPPCEENIDLLATKLYKKQKLKALDIERLAPSEADSAKILSSIDRLVGEYEMESYEKRRSGAVAGEYELIAKMLSHARANKQQSLLCDHRVSEALRGVFTAGGFPDGVIKAYGSRRRFILAAGADKDGSKISAKNLHTAIEKCAGMRLGEPSYYRRGELALLSAESLPLWRADYATASAPSERTDVSGDSSAFFTHDDVFYSLICDGMGSGRVAERTSGFAVRFLSAMLSTADNLSPALSALNTLILNRGEECSATVDLFRFDLLCGEAYFTKCGAAPSFIKRKDSLFRIKSVTAPIGLMKDVDMENTGAEIKSGDYVIMLSDGVSELPDDAVWLFEFLTSYVPTDPQEFANAILKEARKNSGAGDDITVSVVKLSLIQ